MEEIFERDVDLPPAERALYLDRRCGNDRDLRREVEEMIAADRLSNDFIESPVIASSTFSDLLPTIEDSVLPDLIGLRVGAYHLIRELGRGEMGAVFLARRAEKLNPQSPSMFVSFAFCLRNARRFEESLNKLRRALAIQPNNSTALASYCWVVRSLKNYDEAEKACRKVVKLTQRESMPLFGLAHMLAIAGKGEEAAKKAGEMERRRDKQYVPPIYIAQINAALGEINEAVADINKAIELEPRSAIVHSAAGRIYWYARRYEEALKVTRRSLEIDAGFVPGHKMLRIIHETTGDYAQALEAHRLERIYVGNTDEKEPGWMMLAAQVEAAGGNREKAAALLKTATGSAIIRNNPSAYAYETAVAYAMTGDADAAFE